MLQGPCQSIYQGQNAEKRRRTMKREYVVEERWCSSVFRRCKWKQTGRRSAEVKGNVRGWGLMGAGTLLTSYSVHSGFHLSKL